MHREASTVKLIGGVLAWAGWIALAVSIISGIALWSELSDDGSFGDSSFGTADKIDIVLSAVLVAVVASLMLAGMGHALRLFAMYTTARLSGTENWQPSRPAVGTVGSPDVEASPSSTQGHEDGAAE